MGLSPELYQSNFRFLLKKWSWKFLSDSALAYGLSIIMVKYINKRLYIQYTVPWTQYSIHYTDKSSAHQKKNQGRVLMSNIILWLRNSLALSSTLGDLASIFNTFKNCCWGQSCWIYTCVQNKFMILIDSTGRVPLNNTCQNFALSKLTKILQTIKLIMTVY